jgi:hypothetical protein
MKKEYRFIGVSEYAKRHLCEEDIQQLNEMIGCKIQESEIPSIVDGGKMFIMPDGEETHICFLQIEEIQPELKFNN